MDPVQNKTGRASTKFGGGLPDRRERNSQQRSQFEIVESNDCNFTGDADVLALKHAQDLGRGYVIQAEKRSWGLR